MIIKIQISMELPYEFECSTWYPFLFNYGLFKIFCWWFECFINTSAAKLTVSDTFVCRKSPNLHFIFLLVWVFECVHFKRSRARNLKRILKYLKIRNSHFHFFQLRTFTKYDCFPKTLLFVISYTVILEKCEDNI